MAALEVLTMGEDIADDRRWGEECVFDVLVEFRMGI
jgi:hypothetical protein